MRGPAVRLLTTASLAAALCITPGQLLCAQSAAADAATAAAVDAPKGVTVLNAGAAPRQRLRYTLVQGSTESLTMRQKISMNMTMGAMALPSQAFPTTVMKTRFTVADVAADGTAAVEGEFVEVDLDPEGADPMLVNAMKPQLASLNGTTMSYNISPTGQVSKPELVGADPAVMQSLQSIGSAEQLSVPFPTEPVGVGARWTAARSVEQSGMTIRQDMEYLVTSLSADSVVLQTVMTQSAENQAMAAAAMPAGAEATLKTLAGNGTATVVIHFDRVQPVIDMKVDIMMAIEVEMAGQLNTMNQEMAMEIKTARTPIP